MRAPAKHLFGLNRAGQSLALAKPHRVFQPHDQTPWGGPETHCSTPTGYPFKAKAATTFTGRYRFDVWLQFFADLPVGRMLQNHFAVISRAMSCGGLGIVYRFCGG